MRLGWLPLDSAPSAKNGRQCAGLRPALQPLLLPLAQRFRRKRLATPFTRCPKAIRNCAPGYFWSPHLYQERMSLEEGCGRCQWNVSSAILARKGEPKAPHAKSACRATTRFVDRADMGCSSAAPLRGTEKPPESGVWGTRPDENPSTARNGCATGTAIVCGTPTCARRKPRGARLPHGASRRRPLHRIREKHKPRESARIID
jgi:hypothetical protein